jgi:hypothetical protein
MMLSHYIPCRLLLQQQLCCFFNLLAMALLHATGIQPLPHLQPSIAAMMLYHPKFAPTSSINPPAAAAAAGTPVG